MLRRQLQVQLQQLGSSWARAKAGLEASSSGSSSKAWASLLSSSSCPKASSTSGSQFLRALWTRGAATPSGSSAAQQMTTASMAATGGARGGFSLKKLLMDYKQLSKFKLSALVMFTASCGFVAASGEQIDWQKLAVTSLGTFGAAACANTLNQLYEVVNDSRMSRTAARPLPTGRISRLHALAFGVAAGASGLYTLYTQTNETTTALAAFNIFLYAGVYTPLKQLSVANTWVGAIVGAIPPLMGWASAAGQLDFGSSILATALFSWQMPHFMALAWMCKEDYIRGGFRMISMVDPTGRRSALVAVRHSLLLLPVGLAAYLADVTTEAFAWEAAAMAGWMTLYAVRYMRTPTVAVARKMFRASLLYLPLLMAAMVAHRLPYKEPATMDQVIERAQGLALRAAGSDAWRGILDVTGAGMSAVSSVLHDGLLASTSDKCPSKALCEEGEQEEGEQEEGSEEEQAGKEEEGEKSA